MKHWLISSRVDFALLATGAFFLLLLASPAAAQDFNEVAPEPKAASSSEHKGSDTSAASAAPEKARALLDEVRKSENDRVIALKQKEIERLKEDQAKAEKDQTALQKTIDSTTALITDSEANLEKLTTENRRLEHELAVTQARISAERAKTEGLRALSVAQGKSLSALARHGEEADARAKVRSSEMELLNEGKSVPREGSDEQAQDELGKARKALASAEVKTQAEERAAQEAMKAATAKMTLAETKAANAQRLADNDLTLPPATEKSKAKTTEKPAEKKPAEEPSTKKATTTKSAASTPTPAPKPGAKPAATNKPRGLFGGFGR